MEKRVVITAAVGFLAGIGTVLAGQFIRESQRLKADTPTASCFVGEKKVPLFELNGKVFTLDDLPQDIHQSFLLAQMDAFRRTNEIIEELAVRASMTSQAGIPKGQDVFTPVLSKEEEIEAYYKANFAQGKNQIPFEKVREAIKTSLDQQKIMTFVAERLPKLKSEQKFRNLITIPCGPAKEIDFKNSSFVIGETSGPIDVVFFTDFMSPRVRQIISPLNQLAKEGKEKFKLHEVYLFSEKEGIANELAKIAFCAQRENPKLYPVFREKAYMTSTLFTSPHAKESQPQFYSKITLDMAKAAGLKENTLTECLKSNQLQEFITRSKKAAQLAGVSTAPAFFVKGRLLALPASDDPVSTLAELVRSFKH
jgi:protein-disulfide isomerase